LLQRILPDDFRQPAVPDSRLGPRGTVRRMSDKRSDIPVRFDLATHPAA
jgi:hypothetical protein